MKAIFENSGTIVEIGQGLVFNSDDPPVSGGFAPNEVGVVIWQRRLENREKLDYRGSFGLDPSAARAMASAMLAAATQAKTQ